MASMAEQIPALKCQIRDAVLSSSARCLYTTSKWLMELLVSFSQDEITSTPVGPNLVQSERHDPLVRNLKRDAKEAQFELREEARYLLAKSFFDCREFNRCAAVFLPQLPNQMRPVPSSYIAAPHSVSFLHKSPVVDQTLEQNVLIVSAMQSLSQKALFMALYGRYLAGEKRKTEDQEPLLGPAEKTVNSNDHLPELIGIMQTYFEGIDRLENSSSSDGWLEYLYGLFLLHNKSVAHAKQWLLRAINLNPWNWSAWLELSTTVYSQDDLDKLSKVLPRNIMTFFFHIHCSQELLLSNENTLHTIAQLLAVFPTSAYLQQQKAMMHYHAREMDLALHAFDDLLRDHPQRLEGLEIYSNLLYVSSDRPKLAALANLAISIDKLRPETNCILGNYYSLISEHEKAILHFRRALTLDRNIQTAWTLMGHEYIELKNTQAAIESYRRAVDLNGKDYRAWYGLGQGYEMLECYSYSLFYYQRAATLSPGDPKMWAAVGNAYSRCNQISNAIQAYKRALIVGAHTFSATRAVGLGVLTIDQAMGGVLDPQTLFDIATLYERDGLQDEAASYMELVLAQEEGGEECAAGAGVTHITSRARLWLARWAYGRGDWQKTMRLANELCQDGVDVEEAKSLVKDVRARQANTPDFDNNDVVGIDQSTMQT